MCPIPARSAGLPIMPTVVGTALLATHPDGAVAGPVQAVRRTDPELSLPA